MVSFLWCFSCYWNFFVALKTRFSEILFFSVSGKFFSIVSALFFSFLLCTSFLLLLNSSFRYSCIVLSSAKFFVLFHCLYIALFIWYETLLCCFFFITFNLLLLHSFALLFIIRIFHSFESRMKSSISNSFSLRFSYFFKYLVWYILALNLITKIAIVKLFSWIWSFVLQLLIQNSYLLNISTHEITQNEWSHTWNRTVESTEKSDRDIVRVSWPVQITKVSLYS